MLTRRLISSKGVSAIVLAASALLLAPKLAPAQTNPNLFPNTELITQDGKKVHFYDDVIKGKIVAIDFIYTSCGYACPLETARLVQVQQKLGDRVGKDIFFYSISIDPEHDTPKVLRAYMKKYHVGPGWTFLTGKKKEIDQLQMRLGVYSDPRINADGHLPHVLIGNDATGQWTRGNALDNPTFQARMIGEFLDNFKHTDFAAEKNKKTGDGAALAHFNPGQYLFGRDCVACHTIGQGDKVGPDLLGVTRLRDHQWLVRMIQNPDQILKEKDPIATALLKKYKGVPMPHMWLNDDDVRVLIGYLSAKDAEHDKQLSLNTASGTMSGAGNKPAAAGGGPAHPNK